ncbi:MAG: hypothetical protein KAJ18_05680 [Candidatus Omnitrophica bacterium]|nr:hypothetical protein [Candidatus Omnitrophota bacterium]
MSVMQKIIAIVLLFALCGCTALQERVTITGLAGAALGGIIGHQGGDGVKGAAIGGLAGTTAGLVFSTGKKKKTEYEKGYEAGYRQGQIDYANSSWRKKTGQCGNYKDLTKHKEGGAKCDE